MDGEQNNLNEISKIYNQEIIFGDFGVFKNEVAKVRMVSGKHVHDHSILTRG